MPGYTHMIAQGFQELGDTLIAAGNTLKTLSWATGEAFIDLCWMRACLDELAYERLSPEGQQRLAKSAEWMSSPAHKAAARSAFAALQRVTASGAVEQVEELKRKYQRTTMRQRGAVSRLRARRGRTKGKDD